MDSHTLRLSAQRPRSAALPMLVALALLASNAACDRSDDPAHAGHGEKQAPSVKGGHGDKHAKKKVGRPASVQVTTARGGSLQDEWRYLAEIRPLHQAKVAAGVSARVLEVTVRAGDRVEAGNVLATLDSSLVAPLLAGAKATVARIDGQLGLAKREVERAERLRHPVITEPEVDRLRGAANILTGQLREARAVVKRHRAMLALHTITAPFAGQVARRHADAGEWVNPGQEVVELVSIDDLEVIVDVPPTLAGRVAKGDILTLQGFPPVTATVTAVVQALDPTTRTLRVRAAPNETAPWLLPYRTAEAAFSVTHSHEGAVLLTRDALVRGPVSVRVIKMDGETATPITVQVLATAQEDALVLGLGLAPGDTVVTRGNDRLRPGQTVKVEAP